MASLWSSLDKPWRTPRVLKTKAEAKSAPPKLCLESLHTSSGISKGEGERKLHATDDTCHP